MEEDKNEGKKMVPMTATGGTLSQAEFQNLAAVPPELEWFANIDNKRTRRAYQIDLREFMVFVGIRNPMEFRIATRAHMIAWRKTLESRSLSGATIRRKLAALSSLLKFLQRLAALAPRLRLFISFSLLWRQVHSCRFWLVNLGSMVHNRASPTSATRCRFSQK
jgi:hypothetical protein